jgi:hypothetical protein
MPDLTIEEQFQATTTDVAAYATLPPGEWPVGAIIPVFYPSAVEYPVGWTICAGQLISDKDSPFFGRNIPNLAEDRFLMGTILRGSYGQYGGSNQLPESGAHDHQFTIHKGGRVTRTPDGFQAEGPQCGTVTHATSSAGAHNHGGENRPAWFGLIFLIKYK